VGLTASIGRSHLGSTAGGFWGRAVLGRQVICNVFDEMRYLRGLLAGSRPAVSSQGL